MTHSALIVSGAGRYADPWHAYDATSARIEAVLTDHGFRVDTSEDVEGSLARLDNGTELLVVNAGISTWDSPEDASDRAARQGLLRFLGRGGPVLAMHSSASTLPTVPEWEGIIGCRWVEGTTMHPTIGIGHIGVHPERHSIVAQSADFDIWDERYSYLRVMGDLVPLASHEHGGLKHPLLWARRYGRSRVVYDALGHDERSYDSGDHVAIIGRAARWLVEGLP